MHFWKDLEDIQDEIRETVDCRLEMASEKFSGMKDIKSCVFRHIVGVTLWKN